MSPPNTAQVEVIQRDLVEQDSYKPENGSLETREQGDSRDEQDRHNTPLARENQPQNTHATLNNNNEPLKRPEDCDKNVATQNRKCVSVST